MNPILLVIELAPHAPWADVLFFMGVGFLLVLLVLGLLATIVQILGWFFHRSEKKSTRAANQAVLDLAQSEAAAADAGLRPEILAVIAAAVHVSVGAPHRVLSIRHLPAPPNWSLEGRRQMLTSHKTR